MGHLQSTQTYRFSLCRIKANITLNENGKIYLYEIQRRVKGQYPNGNIGRAMKRCFRDLKIKNCRSKEQWTVVTRVYLGVSWRQQPLPVNTSEPDKTDNSEKSELPNSDTSDQLNNSNSGKDFIQYFHM